jgi:tryptophan synthase alpha chain
MKTVSPRIAATFENLRKQNRIAFMPFVPAGYPDLATTAAVLPAMEAGGANLIEIGIPFSDPIADGPTIQAAFTQALANKLKVADVLKTVAAARANLTVPLVAMLSYSIVYRYGLDRFLADAKAAGFDGLILPDLPPPEAQKVCEKVWKAGLDTILLVAPTTTPQRRKEIAKLSSGFIYYLSVSGITGERDALPVDLSQNVAGLRELSSVPVCVGFGISKPSHVRQLQQVADGAIVGSALVKKMTERLSDGPSAIAESVKVYCRSLAAETGPNR